MNIKELIPSIKEVNELFPGLRDIKIVKGELEGPGYDSNGKDMSNFWYGRKLDEEHKENIGAGNKGKIHTEESKEHLSKVMKGNDNRIGTKHTEESKRKIGLKSIGRNKVGYFKHTEETKKKMSELRKGRTPWNKGLTYKTKKTT